MSEAAAQLHPVWQVPVHIGEFWTAKQRTGHSLHEVSYRACFKPPLVRFFLERFSKPGSVVYDPFMGRGTTPLEAALSGRSAWGSDLNPLSRLLLRPRLNPPTLEAIQQRLKAIDFSAGEPDRDDLLVFYHPETLTEISSLRAYLRDREAAGELDAVDDWLRMVAINRLTGHSAGFFSVYSLPPNQAVSVDAQRKINERLKQTPPRRSVPDLILKKSRALLKDLTPETRKLLSRRGNPSRLFASAADQTSEIPSASVDLVVTSPPFLDVVDYIGDNWLRCWFAGIDAASIAISTPSRIEDWENMLRPVFRELHRIIKPGGWIAFEVGEIRKGRIQLEEHVLPLGEEAGFTADSVYINSQNFTKTAHLWGVKNLKAGTNTNRIVMLRKKRTSRGKGQYQFPV